MKDTNQRYFRPVGDESENYVSVSDPSDVVTFDELIHRDFNICDACGYVDFSVYLHWAEDAATVADEKLFYGADDALCRDCYDERRRERDGTSGAPPANNNLEKGAPMTKPVHKISCDPFSAEYVEREGASTVVRFDVKPLEQVDAGHLEALEALVKELRRLAQRPRQAEPK